MNCFMQCCLVIVFLDQTSSSIAMLEKQLGDPDPKIRQQAATELAKRGIAAVPVAKRLLQVYLRDNNGQEMRGHAVRIATGVGPEAEPLIPDLAFVLFQYPNERAGAAAALGKIGKKSGATLKDLATNNVAVPDVRCHALKALGSIGRDAKTWAPDLIPLQQDPNKSVRDAATAALKAIK